VQAKRLASRDGANGDSVADGRALELHERILAIGVEVEPELFLVVMFLLSYYDEAACAETVITCCIDTGLSRVIDTLSTHTVDARR
jgi:hypothetical protein